MVDFIVMMRIWMILSTRTSMSIASSASVFMMIASFLFPLFIVSVRLVLVLVFLMLIVLWIRVFDVLKVPITSYTMVAPSPPFTSSFIKDLLRLLGLLFLFLLGSIFLKYRKSLLLQLFELICIKTDIDLLYHLLTLVLFIIVLKFRDLMHFRASILSVILSTLSSLAGFILFLLFMLFEWTLMVSRASLPLFVVSSLLMLWIVLTIFPV